MNDKTLIIYNARKIQMSITLFLKTMTTEDHTQLPLSGHLQMTSGKLKHNSPPLPPINPAEFINCHYIVVSQEFHGSPVAKTLCSQCWGPRFDPWSGNWISHATAQVYLPQLRVHMPQPRDPICCN